VNDNWRSRVRK